MISSSWIVAPTNLRTKSGIWSVGSLRRVVTVSRGVAYVAPSGSTLTVWSSACWDSQRCRWNSGSIIMATTRSSGAG